MKKNPSIESSANALAIVSLIMSLIVLLPILNWLFKIPPWQNRKDL